MYYNDTLFDYSTKELFSGNYTSYYPGNIKFKGSFLNGCKQGEFTYYGDPKNYGGFFRIDSIVNYEKGKLNGQKLIYFESYSTNLLQKKLNYSNGKLNGTCYFWDYSLQLEKIIKYENDSILEEHNLGTDSTISAIRIALKEFPNDTVDLNKLTDSLTLEVVGEVPNYNNNNSYATSFKKMNNFTIKSYTVLRQMRFQNYSSNKFSSSVFKIKSICADGDVSIVNLILIDKNNVEYEIPKTDFIIKQKNYSQH